MWARVLSSVRPLRVAPAPVAKVKPAVIAKPYAASNKVAATKPAAKPGVDERGLFERLLAGGLGSGKGKKSLFGALPPAAAMLAAALGGAMLGFAPFNRPVAKIFLGDVGSLPIGLLLAWCFVELAFAGHLAAAILLPLYYLADATLTLLRRAAKREPVWQAHRSHFYQRATDNGFKVIEVVRTVFVLNIGLAVLAGMSVWLSSAAANVILLALGATAVAVVLRSFATRR